MDGINFITTFTEEQVTSVPIASPRSFFIDEDINPTIEEVNITLINPQFSDTIEQLIVTQEPPSGISIIVTPHLITLRGSFSPSDTEYETAMLSIEYSNVAEEPGSTPRMISISVSDGRNVNNPPTMVTINIVTVNDVPLVDLNGNDTGVDSIVEYVEGSDQTVLAPKLIITDPDNTNLVSATVRLAEVFDPGNESISLTIGSLSSLIKCEPASCNGVNLQLTGTASQQDYQTVLRTLSYVNLKQPADFPSLFDRIVYIGVSDGANESSSSRNILVDITPINPRIIFELDTPNVNYFINYTEGSTVPVLVTGTVRLVDVSLTNLERLIISIRDPIAPIALEQFAFNTSCYTTTVSIENNLALKRLTVSQNLPIQNYINFLNCLHYVNTEPEIMQLTKYIDILVVPGGGAPNSTVFTEITISHINDNAPQCDLGPTGDSVPLIESTSTGSVIHTLQATDLDVGGQDGIVDYRLVSGNETGFFGFSINEQQLDIILLKTVDFEGPVKSYPLVIESCDGGEPMLCCNYTFKFSLTDANDNPPVFTQESYEVTVDENVEQLIGTFIVNDLDSGNNSDISSVFIQSVSPMGGCMGRFSTTLQPSLSTINGGIDYETTTNCTLVLAVVDAGNPSLTGTATVIVLVQNVDDLPPVLTGPPDLVFVVAEDNDLSTELGQVTATDPDTADNELRFSLLGTPPSEFFITSNTGVFIIQFSTNYSLATEYNVQVRVVDPAGNSVTGDLTIRVAPINNDPPLLDLNSATPQPDNSNIDAVFVEESSSPVTLQSAPFISDPDEVPLTIMIIVARIANGGTAALESLSLNNNTASSHSVLTPLSPFELRIAPSDPANLTAVYAIIQSIQYLNTEDEFTPCRADLHPCTRGADSRTILIHVNDGMFDSVEREAYVLLSAVNDAPEIDLDTTQNDRVFRFVEGDPPTPVANVPNYFVRDDDNDFLFTIECNLTNAQDVGESLVITSTPPAGLSMTGNDTSFIQFSGNASVEAYNTVLGQINYYSSSSKPTIFIRVIMCTAFDGALLSNMATASVMFEELNNIPRIVLGVSTVSYMEEGVPVNLTLNPQIFDEDDISLISLSVSALTGDEHVFGFDNSLISPPLSVTSSPQSLTVNGLASITVYTSILASIYYSNNRTEFLDTSPVIIQFTVTDTTGNISLPINESVLLQPRDDNSPQFVPDNMYNFSISEGADSGTVVGELTITDEDRPIPESPTFSLVSATPGLGSSDFLVRSKAGEPLVAELVVNGPLDYDSRAMSYSLLIRADSGPFSVTANVTVVVINENDIPPMFVNPPNQFTVFESNLSEPLMPHRIMAQDPDGFPVQYNITAGNEFVSVDSNGLLFLSGPVDREGIPGEEFMIGIAATDGVDTVEQNFTVIVQDVNEHAPEFDRNRYNVSITENASPSSNPIVTVQATDRDEQVDILSGSFGSTPVLSMVTFSIQSGPFSTSFNIDSSTGEVTQVSPLDFEMTGSPFNIIVVANDNGSPNLMSSSTISVTVININDEQPFFDPPFVETYTLPENSQLNLQISGRDEDPNSNLNFELTSSLSSIPFMINSASGLVTLTVPGLDADGAGSVREYPLTVTLTDLNTNLAYSSQSSVEASLTILVEDTNDNTPVFSQQSYSMEVTENLMVGSMFGIPLLTVSATDADYGSFPNGSSNGNKEVAYSLIGVSPDLFVINSSTGVISTLKALDREQQRVYEFSVFATDNPLVGVPNFAIASVTITVIDVNEHAPIADPSTYTSTIREDASTPSTLQTNVRVRWSTESEI